MSGKYSMRQTMPSAVFAARLHPRHCILLHHTTIQYLCYFVWEGILLFTLICLHILFADLLLTVYPEPFNKVCFKNIYIIAFANHNMKTNGRETVFTDLFKMHWIR